MDLARARKLGERIVQVVAEMLESRIKDPRLGFVTITDARVTGDLRDATVFYTVYGSAEEKAASAVALASATGVIRSEVGRQTGLKHTPSITFKQDTLPDWNATYLVARAAMKSFREGGRGFETRLDTWTIAARPVTAVAEKCVMCHNNQAYKGSHDARLGQPIGGVLFAFRHSR